MKTISTKSSVVNPSYMAPQGADRKRDVKKHLPAVRREQRERDERIQTVSSLKEALGKIEELEAYVGAIKKLKSVHATHEIKPRQSSNTSEAVAVAVATDWHLGCTIRPEQVSGLNTYDVATAKKRITTFFERVVALTAKERRWPTASSVSGTNASTGGVPRASVSPFSA